MNSCDCYDLFFFIYPLQALGRTIIQLGRSYESLLQHSMHSITVICLHSVNTVEVIDVYVGT